jgi:hypothetical protein
VKPDHSGFYYDRYPPRERPREDRNAYNKVYWHTLNAAVGDVLVFEITSKVEDSGLRCRTTANLVLRVEQDRSRNGIYYREWRAGIS